MRLVVQYDGTDFAGFQIQPQRRTVQGVLEEALARLLQEPVRVVGASRTDAGVHAAGQVVAFTTTNPIPLECLPRALNDLLPRDVAVREAEQVPWDFDPRRAAKRKRYRYWILNRPEPSPFIGRYAWHLAWGLDTEAMAEGSAYLVGRHDFAAFCAAGGAAGSTIRELYGMAVRRRGEIVEIEACGNGFLYMMMRIIVGTLVEIGRGKRRPEEMAAILASGDRRQAGPTAPPQGLMLMGVEY